MATLVEASGSTTATQVQQDQLTTGQIVAILAAGLAAQQTLSLLTRLLGPVGITAPVVKVAFSISGKRQRLTRPDASSYRAPRSSRPTGSGVTSRGGNAAAGSIFRRSAAQGVTVLRPERTPALASALAGEDTYRAAYLLAAATRVQRAVDRRPAGQSQAEALRQAAQRERQFYRQHLDAQARRRQVAAQVDVAALRHGVPFIDGATGVATKLVGWHARLDDKTSPECRAADGANFPANRPPQIGWPGAVHPHCRCRPGAPFATARMVDTTSTQRAA